jgi:hypothetical protein
VCIIVPTCSSLLKGGHSDDERKRRDADTPLVHSSLPEDDNIVAAMWKIVSEERRMICTRRLCPQPLVHSSLKMKAIYLCSLLNNNSNSHHGQNSSHAATIISCFSSTVFKSLIGNPHFLNSLRAMSGVTVPRANQCKSYRESDVMMPSVLDSVSHRPCK